MEDISVVDCSVVTVLHCSWSDIVLRRHIEAAVERPRFISNSIHSASCCDLISRDLIRNLSDLASNQNAFLATIAGCICACKRMCSMGVSAGAQAIDQNRGVSRSPCSLGREKETLKDAQEIVRAKMCSRMQEYKTNNKSASVQLLSCNPNYGVLTFEKSAS